MPTEHVAKAPLRVVFAGRVAREPLVKALGSLAGVELSVVPPDAEVVPFLDGAEVIVMSNPRGQDGAPIAAFLASPKSRIRWTQIVSAGVDGLARYPLPSDLLLTNQGGAVATTVAEHVMAMLLLSTRAMMPILQAMTRASWESSLSTKTRSLEGRSLCVVGFGNIGRQVARLGAAFGMKVTALARTVPDQTGDCEVRPLTQLLDVVAVSDVVVVSLALAEETRHLFNADTFARFKRGSMFVNVSRGEIVDSSALRSCLESGQLGYAFIDVAEHEPLGAQDPLWQTPNLVISPHIAATGGTFTGERIAKMVKDNVLRYQRGEELLNRQSIDIPALS